MKKTLSLILPGILVAATGVGAGDLATASFVGSQLGVAVLWAVVVGAIFKYVLTEGIARWQLVNGHSLLDGLAIKVGKPFIWTFLIYMVMWSFFVGSALISACGASLHAIFPIFEASTGKVVFGLVCSLSGLLIVRVGKFSLFEKVMSVAIAVMFVVVILTAIALWPGVSQVISGLLKPSISSGQDLVWTVALIGGVGGTLTIFCYGYWIREKNRTETSEIFDCKVDLIVGYTITAIFGIAMVIIGSSISVEGRGASLLITLAGSLETAVGEAGKWIFLIGAFFAIFSSLLGVWQAVPYLFADVARHLSDKKESTEFHLRSSFNYHMFQFLLAFAPMLGLLMSFKEVQKLYSVVGTFFMPFLAIALLVFNNDKKLGVNKNGMITNGVLVMTLAFFSYVAFRKIIQN